MPNYIKNSLQLIGTSDQIKSILEKYSTIHPDEHRKSFDGDLVYKSDNGEYGWLNEKTNTFKRRNQEDVLGIPEGFTPDIRKEFTQFPDFNKIFKMPEELNIDSDGWVMPLENEFSANTKFKEHLDKMRQGFSSRKKEDADATLNNFIQGIKNYILLGYATWYQWNIDRWGTKWNSSSCSKEDKNIFTFDTAWSSVPKLINEISVNFPEVEIVYEWSDEDTGSNCGTRKYKNGLVEERILANDSKEAYELAFKLRPHYKENYELVAGTYQYKE